jgi:hypothetical protein
MEHKLELREGAIEEAISQFSAEFAREVGVFADLFEYWRKPDVARAVVESLLDNDRDAFNALLKPEVADPSPIDPRNGDLDETQFLLCYKLLLLLDKLGRMKVTKKQEICRLRTDLSPGERRRYLAIALQFGDGEIFVHERTPDGGRNSLQGPVIPPGPFLEALRAEGLVTCVEDNTIATIDTGFGIFSGVKDMCEFTL